MQLADDLEEMIVDYAGAAPDEVMGESLKITHRDEKLTTEELSALIIELTRRGR